MTNRRQSLAEHFHFLATASSGKWSLQLRLWKISYVSIATAPRVMLEADVRTICLLAKPHNFRAKITGILTFQNGRFAQLLEGPKTELLSLMDRIAVDPRHYSLKILADGPTHIRRYADWSMAYLEPKEFLRNQLDDLLAQTEAVARMIAGTPQ